MKTFCKLFWRQVFPVEGALKRTHRLFHRLFLRSWHLVWTSSFFWIINLTIFMFSVFLHMTFSKPSTSLTQHRLVRRISNKHQGSLFHNSLKNIASKKNTTTTMTTTTTNMNMRKIYQNLSTLLKKFLKHTVKTKQVFHMRSLKYLFCFHCMLQTSHVKTKQVFLMRSLKLFTRNWSSAMRQKKITMDTITTSTKDMIINEDVEMLMMTMLNTKRLGLKLNVSSSQITSNRQIDFSAQ